jgi:L-aspartate oxidase
MRGEGAYLRNATGERFMASYHELAELAPRDVVARAIYREIHGGTATNAAVYLDVTHLDGEKLKQRFPRIYQTCLQFGLDITRERIPVRPAAHYAMGGVRTDLDGRASLAGLFAAGEAACTGAHGANRLASNSLLEGLVFGLRAARAMALSDGAASPALAEVTAASPCSGSAAAGARDADALRSDAQQIMERHVGMVRDASGLQAAIARLEQIRSALPPSGSRRCAETRNIVECGLAIARSALLRKESRGSHYRADFPHSDDARFGRHSVVRGDAARLG